MIYINSCFESSVKDQIHSFIYNNLIFEFADANMKFLFFIFIYNNSNQCKSTISVFGNLSQRNKAFTKFMQEFIYLIIDIGYIDNQFKINLPSVNLSHKINQLLIS